MLGTIGNFSIMGRRYFISDEVVNSFTENYKRESTNAITNDLDNTNCINQNRTAEMITSNYHTNGLEFVKC